jgi:gluconolactonase
MKGRVFVTISVGVLSSIVALAQSQVPKLPAKSPTAPPPSVQAPADPGYEAFVKMMCKTPPAGRGRGGGGAGRGAAPGRGPAPAAGVRDVKSEAIPGVIAAGQTWKFLWQEEGNNGDGIVGTDDGGLMLAQNDNSKVVKLDKNGKPSIAYSDTHTGGAMSMSRKKTLFIVERGLGERIEQLTPKRRVFADKYMGEPLDCIGGVINDITADSKGGAYFTMGGVYYANPKGEITKYGDNITPNGIVLSADEKTLYVTNGTTMAALDVQPDGSLKNQREFAQLGAGGGDGSTIDAAGRVYVTYSEGIAVLSPEGKKLGTIPTPRGVITAAFGGKDKKMLYILARGAVAADGSEVANAAQVWVIPTLAQGFKGRAK